MSRYRLDTGPMTALRLGRPSAHSLIDPWMLSEEVVTSVLVYAEVTEYLLGFANAAPRQQEPRDLLLAIPPLVLAAPFLERYAILRCQLRPPWRPRLIGDIDTFIAVTALEHDLTLVSMDTDFQRVPELKLKLLSRTQ